MKTTPNTRGKLNTLHMWDDDLTVVLLGLKAAKRAADNAVAKCAPGSPQAMRLEGRRKHIAAVEAYCHSLRYGRV